MWHTGRHNDAAFGCQAEYGLPLGEQLAEHVEQQGERAGRWWACPHNRGDPDVSTLALFHVSISSYVRGHKSVGPNWPTPRLGQDMVNSVPLQGRW